VLESTQIVINSWWGSFSPATATWTHYVFKTFAAS